METDEFLEAFKRTVVRFATKEGISKEYGEKEEVAFSEGARVSMALIVGLVINEENHKEVLREYTETMIEMLKEELR